MSDQETSGIITVAESGKPVRYHFVATKAELERAGGQLTRWVDGHDILLYEYQGKLEALSNICRHFGGPVGYLKAEGGVFTCLWHNWQYSCRDGTCLTHPGFPLRRYALKVIGERVYVNLIGEPT